MGDFDLYEWYVLLTLVQRFQIQTGYGLAVVWGLVQDGDLDGAIEEFEAVLGRRSGSWDYGVERQKLIYKLRYKDHKPARRNKIGD